MHEKSGEIRFFLIKMEFIYFLFLLHEDKASYDREIEN